MNYADVVKLAADTITNEKDFYIYMSDSDDFARLHLFVTSIGGKDWYNVSAEIHNGSEYKKGRSCSANDLNEFKHAVGVCWVYIQNNVKLPLSDQIQSATSRVAKPCLSDKAPTKETTFER